MAAVELVTFDLTNLKKMILPADEARTILNAAGTTGDIITGTVVEHSNDYGRVYAYSFTGIVAADALGVDQ